MRYPSRLQNHATYRRHGAGCLCQRRPGGAAQRKTGPRRYHRRLKEHRHERGDTGSGSAATYVIEAPQHDDAVDVDSFTPVIIAESTTTLKRLSVSEAVTELDMTGAPILVFRHAVHGGISVVYRRPDGHFGWIDPTDS